MEFRPVKFFDMGDNAASSFVRFYLSLKVKFGISYRNFISYFAFESQTTLLFYLEKFVVVVVVVVVGGGGLKDFCQKKLLPRQASELTAGNMGWRCKHAMRSKGQGFRKTWKLISARHQEVTFPGS